MISKLILFLYKRLIKRMVKDYDKNKDCYSGEMYINKLKTTINISKALKQQIDIPGIFDIFNNFIDFIAAGSQVVIDIVILVALLFYSLCKLLIFPFRIYIVKIVRKEILKRIEETEQEIKTNEFIKLCNKDFSNVEYIGKEKYDNSKRDLFWYNEEVIIACGVDDFKIKDTND